MENSINWRNIKVVVFDVDGTLYSQKKLRWLMLFDLLKYYSLKPWRFRELITIMKFRNTREYNAMNNESDIENTQYKWTAEKIHTSPEKVRNIIEKWIFKEPIKHLNSCKYLYENEFINSLINKGVKIAIFSDYPAKDKLKEMKINYDICVCSTDKWIDALKPNPKGLLYIIDRLNVKKEECLFIGDRQERDGEAAIRAGISYLILDKSDKEFYLRQKNNFTSMAQ